MNLKRIEEKHALDNGACVGYFCQQNPDEPCDVVKLARALDDAIGWARRTERHDWADQWERVLREVAGGKP